MYVIHKHEKRLLPGENGQGPSGEDEFIAVKVKQVVDLLPDTTTQSAYLSC
jgi:hypothetical protein